MKEREYSALSRSRGAQKTLRALMELTDLPIRFVPFSFPLGQKQITCPTSPFCKLLTRSVNGRCACEQFLAKLRSRLGPKRNFVAARCSVGLTALAVPVRVAGLPVAMVVCGGCLSHKQSRQDYVLHMQRLRRLGIRLHPIHSCSAYRQTPVLPPGRLRAALQVLMDLARHLGELASHYTLAAHAQEPPCVAVGKTFAQKHLTEPVRTHEAAHEAHVSEEHFCRVFKETTGMTFSEYVARARIEQAKHLLADPKLRVTDVALAAGFQSIPHFNHTFKRLNGTSPKRFRAHLKH